MQQGIYAINIGRSATDTSKASVYTNTRMPSELAISLQPTMIASELPLKEQTIEAPNAGGKFRSSETSDETEDNNPALDDCDEAVSIPKEQYERSSSFLPQTGFSDDSSEGGDGFFIEEDTTVKYEDHYNDVHDITDSDQQESDFQAASKKLEEEDQACDETALLSTSPSTWDSFPRRSILKADVEEEIPINTKKSKWSKLPVPDMDYVKMKRIESLNSISSSYNNSTPDLAGLNDQLSKSPPKALKKSDSKVKFQHIIVREYAQTIGDNPSVGYGAPITLDWEYEENEPLDLDLYEGARGGRRNIRQMHLNAYQRKNIFVHKYGFSEQEVKAAKKATNKVRSQREFSKIMQTTLRPLITLEEMRESAVRKFQRYRGRSNSVECESSIWLQNMMQEKAKESLQPLVEDPEIRRAQSAPSLAHEGLWNCCTLQ